MSPIASLFLVAGALVMLLAGAGTLRLRTPYARIHAAGKASPTAFIVMAIGAGLELGWAPAGVLALGAVALVLTLPLAVHLLFRAIHASNPDVDPSVDELRNDGSGGPTTRPEEPARDES